MILRKLDGGGPNLRVVEVLGSLVATQEITTAGEAGLVVTPIFWYVKSELLRFFTEERE